MFRAEFIFTLVLVVTVTVAQTNSGYTYYGTSNVRIQRPQPIYGRRPLVLPRRPTPVTGPVTVAPVAPAVTAAPAVPAPPTLTVPSYSPAPAPGPIYIPSYRPQLPPRSIIPARPVVAISQPTDDAEPQPTLLPVTEVLPEQPVEVNTPETTLEPAAIQPWPIPISIENLPGRQLVPIPIREPEPVQLPESVQQSEPIAQPETVLVPEPIAQPETVLVPEPIGQQEIVLQPEPVPQYETVLQPELIVQPETVLLPQPVEQPEPVPQPDLVRESEPVERPIPESLPITRSVIVPQYDKPVALPPLLPKPQATRDTDFGQRPQHTVSPMIYYPTVTLPTYTTPRTVATQPPPVYVTRTTIYLPPITQAPVTQAPVTPAPMTSAPMTSAPVTRAPVTPAPMTSAPITPSSVGRVTVTQAPGLFISDFQCKEENGYYSIAHQCDSYIQCKGGSAMQYVCPDGLHFNPATKYFEYPCAYPSEVKCLAGDQEQNPKPTDTCPNQYGFYSMNDGDCSRFVMCQEGLATIMNCPMGLVFNTQTSTCDWPVNVPQCDPSVFKDFTCPDPEDEDGQLSDIIMKYRYHADCKLYIACQLGRPRLLSCERGFSFDEESASCIDEDYVTDCAVPSHLQ